MKRIEHHVDQVSLLCLIATVLWMLVGPGWPLGWATFAPVALLVAYLVGWLGGERMAWESSLRAQQAHHRSVIAIAQLLRDPAFVRARPSTRDAQLRDVATWN